MLTEFEVRNYKSIKQLDLHMRPFMVLVGPNGAGKTNVVRSLELFGEILRRGTTDPATEQGWDQIIRREKKPARGGLQFRVQLSAPWSLLEHRHRRGSPHNVETPEGSLTIEASLTLSGAMGAEEVRATKESLKLSSEASSFEVKADEAGISVDPGDDPRLWTAVAREAMYRPDFEKVLSSRESAAEAFKEIFSQRSLADETARRVLRILNFQRFYLPWISFLAESSQVTRIRLDSSALRSDSAFKDHPGAGLLGATGEGLAAAVDKLRGHNPVPGASFQGVLTSLRKVYPRIEDVRPHRIRPGRLTLLFREVGISEDLGLESVSDGVLHALALLVMLEGGSRSRGVLAIEEPENAIHPWSVRAIVQHAQEESKRQIIITTHSETVVNAVQNPDALFLVESTAHGGTVVSPARQRESALDTILRESGEKLGDLWVSGTLGGVPGSET